jgi:hypothetical protein
VTTTVGGVERTTWMLPSVTGGTSAPEIYLGMNGAERIDSLVVTWPDGTQTTRTGVAAGMLDVEQE